MKKKVIMICALGIGMVLLSANSTRLLVQSSEINENISPETPEEAKSYYDYLKGTKHYDEKIRLIQFNDLEEVNYG